MTSLPLNKLAGICMVAAIGLAPCLRSADDAKADAPKAAEAKKEDAKKADDKEAKKPAEKAEKAEKTAKAEKKKAEPAPKSGFTQGEAAIALANKLALFPALPNAATAQEASAALAAQGIAPFDGWKPGEVLNRGDFAKILVEALGRGGEIPADKKDKAEAYVDLLKGMGVNVESSKEGLSDVDALPEVFNAAVDGAAVTSDPLRARLVYGHPDERVTGTDALINPVAQRGIAPPAPPVVTPPAPPTPAKPRPSKPRPPVRPTPV